MQGQKSAMPKTWRQSHLEFKLSKAKIQAIAVNDGGQWCYWYYSSKVKVVEGLDGAPPPPSCLANADILFCKVQLPLKNNTAVPVINSEYAFLQSVQSKSVLEYTNHQKTLYTYYHIQHYPMQLN